MGSFYPTIRLFFSRHLTPPRIFVLSFAVMVFLGTMILSLPQATSGKSLGFVDALFTSASAVCVTGLSTIDVGRDLSFFGQVALLFLFQVGGLGIITFSVVLFTLMGRDLSFKGREIAQSTLLNTPRRDMGVIFKKVLFYTFVVECLGGGLLFIRFLYDFPPADALFQAVFHAVSAFNNCGFSLFSNSLMDYTSDVTVNLTMMALIILGGIGFFVQQEVLAKLRGDQKRLSLHARMVLITSAILIVGGAIVFYFMEMSNSLRGASVSTGVLVSFFQSVTARTSGFNTIDIGSLTNSTILVLMGLMFIGASPGSAGGGVKTTSFAILALLIYNRIRGNERVNVANRTIPGELLERTVSIVFAAMLIIGLATAALLLFSSSSLAPLASRPQFIEYVFEAFSAFGTVGLSMGITPHLNTAQKFVIIAIMFIGRVGPLSLAFAWYSGRRKGLTYAEESVMVG